MKNPIEMMREWWNRPVVMFETIGPGIILLGAQIQQMDEGCLFVYDDRRKWF